jgi:hypothetical protein
VRGPNPPRGGHHQGRYGRPAGRRQRVATPEVVEIHKLSGEHCTMLRRVVTPVTPDRPVTRSDGWS